MCSGAAFNLKNGIHVSQYGGYYGGSLELSGKVVFEVNNKQSLSNIKTMLEKKCTKKMLVEILAGIVKYADE